MTIKTIVFETHGLPLEYARPGGGVGRTEHVDWSKERERLKDSLIPFIKESIQRQLREEREYYRSRPSLAVRHLEQAFGAGNVEQALLPRVTAQVYERIEERIRRESIRRGR